MVRAGEQPSPESNDDDSEPQTDGFVDHRQSPAFFRDQFEINAGGGENIRYGPNLDDWQREDLEMLDEGWKAVAGQKSLPDPVLRAYLERPKGHSKTTDIAVMAGWALFAAKHKIVGVVAAASKDQAKLIRDAVDDLVAANPWLDQFLEIRPFVFRAESLFFKVDGGKVLEGGIT